MHPISVLTFGFFLAGYITARWDLVSQLIELAVFGWERGVFTRAAKGFGVLSIFFVLVLIPIERIASKEAELVSISEGTAALIVADCIPQHPRPPDTGISAREQLRRRGSF